MAKQFLIPALIFIPVAILQMSVVPLISLDYIAPDLIIILLVFFSINNGRTYVILPINTGNIILQKS